MASCGQPAATPEPILLRVSGSTSMSSLVSELAEAYSLLSPMVALEVTGLGTELGLQDLIDGRADIGMASWLPAYAAADLKVIPIARDAIAVIVHPSNSQTELSLVELQDLYSGRVHTWRKAVGQQSGAPVQPVCREEGSGTRAAFEEMAMGDVRVTPRATIVHSSEAMVEYVAEHPDAIGYVSMGSVTADVKVLALEGQTPRPATAARGSYPLTRELWLVCSDPPADAVQAFLRYVLEPAGQQIAERSFGRIR